MMTTIEYNTTPLSYVLERGCCTYKRSCVGLLGLHPFLNKGTVLACVQSMIAVPVVLQVT